MNKLIVDIPLSNLHRKNIMAIASSDNISISFASSDLDLSQHFEGALITAFASLAVGLINLLLAFERRFDNHKWNLEKIKQLVKTQAAEYIGTDSISKLQFEELDLFLEHKGEHCKVITEINDEIYTFQISRKGEVMIIKWADA